MTKKTDLIQPDRGQDAIAIHLVNKDGFEAWAKGLSGPQRAALAAQKFEGGGYQVGIVPDGDGWFAVGGVADPAELSSWCMAKLAEALPAGTYRRAEGDPGPALHGWQTAQYRFSKYKEDKKAEGPRVLLTKEAKGIEAAMAEARAACLVMDLVNTPAEDMGPAELEAVAERIAKEHGAKVKVTRGDALEQEFPLVHAVGRAAERKHAPRMIELAWGDAKAPKLAIVGKGVCFDSGGLDVKPASGMLLMKKDMGGAAHALALAGLVMGAALKVRLHVLVPAVENAIAGNAFRPGDVLRSRKGLTVEIGNTDAEGRLILADALALADEEKPELLIDMATLTGAARVALGPDLPPFFTDDEQLASDLAAFSVAAADPLWRLPLWMPYDGKYASKVADINNVNSDGFAGSVIAALFLKRFVEKTGKWAHFDIFGWNPADRPHGVTGGEAMGIRAIEALIAARYPA
jgi:leucyl aminopeptidase